jgi:two-component system nitrate/nitrite response regulator NarL
VMKILRQGASNKLIAKELGLSDNTVKVHIRQIIRKLAVTNRTQAAILARART